MRYYSLELTPRGASTPSRVWTSYPGGVYDPQALEIEFDMPIMPATDSTAVTITLSGISLKDLTQVQQFAGMTLTLKGGMKAGFPLINPAQAGILVQGEVFQSFGNWEGTEMTLDFVVYPSIYTIENPGNMVLNWKSGQALGDALRQTLETAYPNTPLSINTSSDLVNSFDSPHYCATIEQLADFVRQYSTTNFNNPVTMAFQQGGITVNDATYTPKTVQLDFFDLIGQPTWIEVKKMVMKLVLRGDLTIGSIITMPKGLQNAPGIVTTTSDSLPSSEKYKSSFQGPFTVTALRHIGVFRSSDAGSWATIVQAIANG